MNPNIWKGPNRYHSTRAAAPTVAINWYEAFLDKFQGNKTRSLYLRLGTTTAVDREWNLIANNAYEINSTITIKPLCRQFNPNHVDLSVKDPPEI